jgi:enamine deaminase RidA (YjgF/YER057c/UK114 family)
MNTPLRPTGIAPPAASYELGMLVPAGSDLVHTAGIVGTAPDGSTPQSIAAQAEEMWRSVGAILAEAGFEPADVVSYTTYVVAGEDLSAVMGARDRFLGDHRAASVLITVPALARPEWKVEVAVVAARQS